MPWRLAKILSVRCDAFHVEYRVQFRELPRETKWLKAKHVCKEYDQCTFENCLAIMPKYDQDHTHLV